MSFKKYDGSVWQAINPKQLKGIPYTGTLPAVLAGTKAGYLHKYKIYGNTEQTGTPTPENPIEPQECGERTENLFNMDESEQGEGYASNTLITASGGSFTAAWAWSSEYISINPETDYCWFSDLFRSGQYSFIAFYTARKTFINTIAKKYALNPVEYAQDNCTLFTTPADAYYMRVSIDSLSTMNLLTEGSTPPESYIPYGYQLPLLSGSTPVDIYIGDTPLGTDEYVDYGEQKIYKRTANLFDKNGKDTANGYLDNSYLRSSGTIVSSSETEVSEYINVTVGTYYTISRNHEDTVRSSSICFYNANKEYISGVSYDNQTVVTVQAPNDATYARYSVRKAYEATSMLTEGSTAPSTYIPYLEPTDPPVPFPQIPTTANSTTISWAGQGLEPSEFDSIQEWVDIPTYKRVNGEWVADN